MSLRNRATPATVGPSLAVPVLPVDSAAEARFERLLAGRRSTVKSALMQKPSPYLRERHEALTCALTQPCVVRWEAPAELVNRGNGSQGVSVKGMHARAASRKAQRALGERIAMEFNRAHHGATGRTVALARETEFFTVVLTRIAPRRLDGPNLDHTFKSVIDGIAAGLGIDDRSSLVRYVTSQEQGAPRQHSVRAELFIQGRATLSNGKPRQICPKCGRPAGTRRDLPYLGQGYVTGRRSALCWRFVGLGCPR